MIESYGSSAGQSPAFAQMTGRVRALFHGHLLADSGAAVRVREDGQPERWYFPVEDVSMSSLRENDHSRPFADKGVARYFTIYRDGELIEDVACRFESPNSAYEDLRGLITFDPEYVKIEVGDDAQVAQETSSISEYIRHTDSGSGLSQEERWEANVSNGDEAETR